MSFGIYAIEFPDRNIYVGITEQSFRKRFRDHKRHMQRGDHRNQHVRELVSKYGIDGAKIYVLETSRDPSELKDREVFWVTRLKNEGYKILNISEYGSLGGEEVKERMRSKLRSKEVRDKISRTMRGVQEESKDRPKVTIIPRYKRALYGLPDREDEG